jgi:hypothetical protein
VKTTEREPNRYCSVGGTVSSCTRTDVFYSLAATEPVSTGYTQPGPPDSGEPFTLYLFATESDEIPVSYNPVDSAPIPYTTVSS